jgi:NADH-quinone oxidoreductase subunit M
MSLGLLLIVAFGGSLLTYLLGKVSARIRDAFAVLISLAVVVMVASLYGKALRVPFYEGFLGMPLVLRVDGLSWLFAIVASVLGCLSVVFSLGYMKGKERTSFYYSMLLLVSAAMLGVVLSGDLLSLFIFWEIMSWSTFLLISYNGGPALAAGMKYFVMSFVGSLAMLAGVVTLHGSFGTLEFTGVAAGMSSASPGYVLAILVLFGVAFGTKNAIWPFHAWLPPAHSEAPSPFSAVLSGVLIKMGVYGFLLLMFVIVGLRTFLSLGVGRIEFHTVLSIIGAITILLPTFIAIFQNDAKRLLAWSTVAQAGYIILGISFGTSLSVAGGMFHFLNHAVFKALLFMVVGAVEYRTNGVRDLDSLGGLIKRMPVTFIVAVIGVCGLIGVPLTNGFVSKWLIYKTLILERSPFLAFAALFGTWGTILYSYKFLHNIFLGQLPQRYEDMERAPFTMLLPMTILSVVVVLFGVLPGIPLAVIDTIGVSFGFESLHVTPWGIASDTGALNTVNMLVAALVGLVVVWCIFRSGARSVSVGQADSYAAGAAVPRDKYQYSVRFYAPLRRMMAPYLKDLVDSFYMRLAGWVRGLGDGLRRIYTGYVGDYVMYILVFLAVLIFVQIAWSPW